jgi:NAD(P)-dependent dehydrogenase (short-subunit alcohol dehydrogenase family)
MQLDLSGRTALVTGSTGGIGRAIAADLARAGARVIVNGRTAGRVDAAVAELREETGGELVGVAADEAGADGADVVAAAEPDVAHRARGDRAPRDTPGVTAGVGDHRRGDARRLRGRAGLTGVCALVRAPARASAHEAEPKAARSTTTRSISPSAT